MNPIDLPQDMRGCMENPKIQEAFRRFHEERYEDVEVLLRKAVEVEPESLAPRVHLANLLGVLHRMDEAVPILEPIQSSPDATFECRWLFFQALVASGDCAEAFRLARGFADDPGFDGERISEVIQCARRSGDWQFALELARKQGDPRQISDLRWMVLLSRLAGVFPGFLIRPLICGIRRISPIRGTGRLAHIAFRISRRLLILAGIQDRTRWARAMLQLAANLDPGEPLWPRLLGQLCRRTRDIFDPEWEQERTWYLTALRIDPNDWTARHGLLQTLFDTGGYAELLKMIGERTCPEEDSRIPAIRAACFTNLGQIEKAKDLYRSMEDSPNGDLGRFCRALICLEESCWKEALGCLVQRTDREGLQILVDYFRCVCRYLCSGGDLQTLDGQIILDEMYAVPDKSDESPQREGQPGCVLCGWGGPRVALWRDRVTGWVRVRCPRCSMITVHPMPTSRAIRMIYDNDGREDLGLLRGYRKALLDVLNTTAEDCRRLPPYKDVTEWDVNFKWHNFEQSIEGEKRYLDVGCSAGRMVAMFRRCGWVAEGIDMDPQAIAFAQSHGVNVRLGSPDTVALPRSHYHLITLIDVIEHVPDPQSVVRTIRELLSPGGLFYVKTPAADSLPHRFLGDRWLDAPEHLQFFSRRTLLRLLRDVGFDIVAYRQDAEYVTPYLHAPLWQEQFYPELLTQWIKRLRVGDVIMVLARKPA